MKPTRRASAMTPEHRKLFRLARKARENAYAPISHFLVGAAVLTKAGRCYVGCNVESPAFTGSTHAEMNAIDTAVAAGERDIKTILIVLDIPVPKFPCALCRQKIVEFGPKATVVTCTLAGDYAVARIQELYPDAFTLDVLQ